MHRPVVDEPIGQRRHVWDVLTDVAERAGFKDDWFTQYNTTYDITDPEFMYKPGDNLDWNGLGDRIYRWVFGKEKGLDYFMEHGYVTWPKPIKDTYWRWELNVRVPVYMEYLINIGQEMKEIGDKVGISLDWEQFTPLPDYFKTVTLKEMDEEYNLIAFSYRDVLHTNSQTTQNPWLDEVSELTPYTYTITMNAGAASERQLKDGDTIWLETPHGRKEKGVLKVMEGQHPLTVGICGQAGLIARGRPVAKGKGVNFCKLLPTDLNHYDPIGLNIETSVTVKVYKAERL